MEKKIHFRAVLEVLGAPQEHVEQALKSYVEKLKNDKNYEVTHEEFAETKKQDDQELWANFAELEIKAAQVTDIINFCFDYMPSLIEIIQPEQLPFKSDEASTLFNELMGKLHSVDMIAKQLRLENDHLKNDRHNLLKNYITILLRQHNLSADALSHYTGVVKDKLEDFLDELIDEGKIDLKEGVYFLKEDPSKN